MKNMARFMALPVRAGYELLQRKPIAGNMLISGVIMGAGDLVAQRIEFQKQADKQGVTRSNHSNPDSSDSSDSSTQLHLFPTQGVDGIRTAIMTSYSTFFFAPYCYFFYKVVNEHIKAGGFMQAAKKGIVSNLGINPVFNFVFFSYSTLVETVIQMKRAEAVLDVDKISTNIERKLQAEYFTACKISLLFWIPTNTLNFWIVPAPLRVIAASFCAVLWGCYLSLAQHKDIETNNEATEASSETTEAATSSYSQ